MKKDKAIAIYLKATRAAKESIDKIAMWDEQKSIIFNANNLNMSVPNASSFKKRFGLKVAKSRQQKYNNLALSGRKEVYNLLIANGYNTQGIADLFNVTHQSVSEALGK